MENIIQKKLFTQYECDYFKSLSNKMAQNILIASHNKAKTFYL